MADFNLIDSTTRLLQKSLDLREQRQQVIAGNVANAETPGYAKRTFEFEKRLQAVLKRPRISVPVAHPKHFPLGTGDFRRFQGEVARHPDRNGVGDLNTVVMEDEMLALSENQILYETGAKLTKRKLQLLKYAVNDGR
jgi:flagellar basal-body rod protein FlgB